MLTAATPDRRTARTLTRLAHLAPLALAGGGATRTAGHAVGARLLTDDPITAAKQMPRPRSRWDSVRQRPGAEETFEIKADGADGSNR